MSILSGTDGSINLIEIILLLSFLFRLKDETGVSTNDKLLSSINDNLERCVNLMYSKIDVDNSLEVLSKEYEEAMASFKARPDIHSLHCIRDLTTVMLNISKIGKKMSEKYNKLTEENKYSYYEYPDYMQGNEYTPKNTPVEVFTETEAKDWVAHLITENPDGTKIKGAHWTIDQTTAVAKQKGIVWEHIEPYHFWVTMNMMYSDYLKVATKHNVTTPDFYADLSKAFLFDVDAVDPKTKLMEYYHHIAKPKF